jgi:hypothetical protein
LKLKRERPLGSAWMGYVIKMDLKEKYAVRIWTEFNWYIIVETAVNVLVP